MTFIFIFTIIFSIFAHTIQAKTIDIPCDTDKQCIEFFGKTAICKESQCICNNATVCILNKHSENMIQTMKLGEECVIDSNCNIQYSICDNGFCTCSKDFAASADNRKCLKVSDGLDAKCDEDVQCYVKTPGSICQDSKCVCNQFHNPHLFECIEKTGLNRPCKNNEQCIHIPHSYCGTIFCECEKGHIQSESLTKCLPIITESAEECEEDIQCKKYFGSDSKCVNKKCQCNQLRVSENSTVCPNRLKRNCTSDSECKNFLEDTSMFCELGKCECQLPYVEENNFCNGIQQIFPEIFILIAGTLINLKFYFMQM